MNVQRSDVLLIGCGPTGLVLTHLLGQLGLRVNVLEKERDVPATPRATYIDGETLRAFQATGLLGALWPHTCIFGHLEIVDSRGKLLLRAPARDLDSPHGYPESRFFDQVAFERILRADFKRFSNVALYVGTEATSIEQRGNVVCVEARQQGREEPLSFVAEWAIGCDGGRSLTRRVIAARMQSLSPKRFWFIVDTVLKAPEDAALLPHCFRYVLGRERVVIFAHGIGLNRRFEFELQPNEPIPEEAVVRRWVSAFIDPDRLEFRRAVGYTHNALVAKNWRQQRILIAGDAAHMLPPSAGQGMCSGIRDAMNLAWKLHRVHVGNSGGKLLDTYQLEREPQIHETLKASLLVSRSLRGDSRLDRWRRLGIITLARGMAPLRAWFQRRVLRRRPLQCGFIDPNSSLGGYPFPQTTAIGPHGSAVPLDDLIGYRFALVVAGDLLTAADLDWAMAQGVGIWRRGRDFMEIGNLLSQWMRKHRQEFVLVRPDRQIFGGGKMRVLSRVMRSFEAQCDRPSSRE